MQLKEKGAAVEINTTEDVKVKIKWSGEVDFDAIALFEKKDGTKGIVYFGTEGEDGAHGSLIREPFIRLDKDSTSGGEENLVVGAKAIAECKKVHLCVMDYKAVKGQKRPEFNTSDLMVHVDNHEVHPNTAEDCNFIEMAVIQNDNGKISVLNKSIQGKLAQIDDADMWNIIANG